MGRRFGGRKESGKTKRRKLLPVEPEERGMEEHPQAHLLLFKCTFLEKEKVQEADARLELESIPFKGCRKHMGKNRSLFQGLTWARGPGLTLGSLRRSAST